MLRQTHACGGRVSRNRCRRAHSVSVLGCRSKQSQTGSDLSEISAESDQIGETKGGLKNPQGSLYSLALSSGEPYQHVLRGSAESGEEEQRMAGDAAAAPGPLVGGSEQVHASGRAGLPVHQQQVASFTDQQGGIFCRTSRSREGSRSCLPAGWAAGRLVPFFPLSC